MCTFCVSIKCHALPFLNVLGYIVYVHTCLCVCTRAHGCAMCMCDLTCGHQRSMLDAFLNCSLPYFLTQSLTELIWLQRLASELHESACFSVPSSGVMGTTTAPGSCVEDLNSGPYAWAVAHLPSLHFLRMFFNFHLCECFASRYVCVLHVCLVATETREGIESP